MIISDFNHLEEVTEASIFGGGDVVQYADLDQDAKAVAKGDDKSTNTAVALNIGSITQDATNVDVDIKKFWKK